MPRAGMRDQLFVHVARQLQPLKHRMLRLADPVALV